MSNQKQTTTTIKFKPRTKTHMKCYFCPRTDCLTTDQYGRLVCSDDEDETDTEDEEDLCRACGQPNFIKDPYWNESNSHNWRICLVCKSSPESPNDEDEETFEEKEKKILDKIEINMEDAIALFGK